jgi:hypothetical protein
MKSSQTSYLHYDISVLSSNDAIAVKDSYNVIWFAIVVAVGSNEIEIQWFHRIIKEQSKKQSKKCYILSKDKTTISINSVICSGISFEVNIIFQTYILFKKK